MSSQNLPIGTKLFWVAGFQEHKHRDIFVWVITEQATHSSIFYYCSGPNPKRIESVHQWEIEDGDFITFDTEEEPGIL